MPLTPQTQDIQIFRTRFETAVGSLVRRDGVDRLMSWLEKSDFYTAPASSRYHGAWPGGLCSHSLDTWDEMCRLEAAYPELGAFAEERKMPLDESMATVSLFHDLCKVNFYKTEKRNRKNEEGVWESYDAYAIDEKYKFGGHGSKSVFLIQNFIQLRPEEAAAINCHMGIGDGQDHISEVYEQNPLAFLLHVADEAACFLKPIDRSGEE